MLKGKKFDAFALKRTENNFIAFKTRMNRRDFKMLRFCNICVVE